MASSRSDGGWIIAGVAAIIVAVIQFSGPKPKPSEPTRIEQQTQGLEAPPSALPGAMSPFSSKGITRQVGPAAMKGCGLVFGRVAVAVSTARAATITQHTEGWCSPAVWVKTQGHVTITCHGVDPKALQRLNELLDKKDLELQEQIREAEDWTHKYHELSQRLAEAGKDDKLARQADTLLKEGKLEAGRHPPRPSA